MKDIKIQSIQQVGYFISDGEMVPISDKNPMPIRDARINNIPESVKMMDNETTYETDVNENNTIVIHISGPDDAEVKFFASIGDSGFFAMPGNKINDLYLPNMTGKNGDALSFSVSLLDRFRIESNKPITVNGKVL